jgi:hypothetical protein
LVEAETGRPFPRTSLARSIRTLRSAGLLVVDLPDDMLVGRSPHYSIDPVRAQVLLSALVESLGVESGPSTTHNDD